MLYPCLTEYHEALFLESNLIWDKIGNSSIEPRKTEWNWVDLILQSIGSVRISDNCKDEIHNQLSFVILRRLCIANAWTKCVGFEIKECFHGDSIIPIFTNVVSIMATYNVWEHELNTVRKKKTSSQNGKRIFGFARGEDKFWNSKFQEVPRYSI